MKLTLPLPPNVANARMHHMKKYRVVKEWMTAAYATMLEDGQRFPKEPWRRARVKCSFYVWRLMDRDNLEARQKPLMDFLKGEIGFFPDDSPDHVELLPAEQSVDRKRQRVEVELERLA